MESQDDWLEGVRRWYFGGEAPEGAERDEQIVWPSSTPVSPASAASPGAHPVRWHGAAAPARLPGHSACGEPCQR